MSRYTVPVHHANCHAVVGWNRTSETFFAEVYDRTGLKEGDAAVLLFATGGTIVTVEELARRLRPYAVLSNEIRRSLWRDQAQRPTPPPLRQWAHDLLVVATERASRRPLKHSLGFAAGILLGLLVPAVALMPWWGWVMYGVGVSVVFLLIAAIAEGDEEK